MQTFQENLIAKLGKKNLEKIESTQIGIAGCGGLGSNCAANLVRVGFKNLVLVDFDVVTESNLDRQFYFADQVGMAKVEALKKNLCQIVPQGLNLILLKERVLEKTVSKIFGNCHIVAECFDLAESKSMLVTKLLAEGKNVVAVSGLGGIGKSDEIVIRHIKKNFVLIGDLNSDIQKAAALSPRVQIAAAKQADTILEFVLAQDKM